MGKYCVMEMWGGFCVHKPNQELLRRYFNYGYGGCQELQMLLILTSLYRLFNQTHSETFNLSLNVIAKKQSLMLAKPWKKFWINDQIDIPDTWLFRKRIIIIHFDSWWSGKVCVLSLLAQLFCSNSDASLPFINLTTLFALSQCGLIKMRSHSIKKRKALRKWILKTPNPQLNFHFRSPKTLS